MTQEQQDKMVKELNDLLNQILSDLNKGSDNDIDKNVNNNRFPSEFNSEEEWKIDVEMGYLP